MARWSAPWGVARFLGRWFLGRWHRLPAAPIEGIAVPLSPAAAPVAAALVRDAVELRPGDGAAAVGDGA